MLSFIVVVVALGLAGLLVAFHVRRRKMPPKARLLCTAWQLVETGGAPAGPAPSAGRRDHRSQNIACQICKF